MIDIWGCGVLEEHLHLKARKEQKTQGTAKHRALSSIQFTKGAGKTYFVQ
jgi:hypothetical protein